MKTLVRLICVGLWLQFTNCSKPEEIQLSNLSTDSAEFVTHNSALIKCTILDLGGSYALKKGACWSIKPNPTIEDESFSIQKPSEAQFEVPLSLLTPNTVYFVRGFVMNQEGISYGNQIEIKTDEIVTFTDQRDNQKYPIIKIGDQVWMASNLNFSSSEKSYYFQNDSIKYASLLGRLYSWRTACSVCPNGWHLPTDQEWKKMELTLGMSASETEKELYRGNSEASEIKVPDFNLDFLYRSTNSTGFSALPGGFYSSNTKQFDPVKVDAYFWTSTPITPGLAWSRKLEDRNNQIIRFQAGSTDLYQSVRCIKN